MFERSSVVEGLFAGQQKYITEKTGSFMKENLLLPVDFFALKRYNRKSY